jgi:hypothetical protein
MLTSHVLYTPCRSHTYAALAFYIHSIDAGRMSAEPQHTFKFWDYDPENQYDDEAVYDGTEDRAVAKRVSSGDVVYMIGHSGTDKLVERLIKKAKIFILDNQEKSFSRVRLLHEKNGRVLERIHGDSSQFSHITTGEHSITAYLDSEKSVACIAWEFCFRHFGRGQRAVPEGPAFFYDGLPWAESPGEPRALVNARRAMELIRHKEPARYKEYPAFFRALNSVGLETDTGGDAESGFEMLLVIDPRAVMELWERIEKNLVKL